MSRTIVIPDVHHRWNLALKPLEITANRYIFLGDYFDNFGDTLEDTANTVRQLIELSKRDDVTLLFGNHDIGYRFKGFECSGWTKEKCDLINKMMPAEVWEKMQLVTYVDGFILSHAGLAESIFSHPIDGITPEYVAKLCVEGLEHAQLGIYTPALTPGQARGGRQRQGGLDWLDFNQEFAPIKGINQIFGHTPAPSARQSSTEDSINWCIDTHSKGFVILENGKVFPQEIKMVDFLKDKLSEV